MSDKYLVYPLVKHSDIIYTKFHIIPNTITLYNNIVITPCLLYLLYYNYYLYGLCLVWFRAYLDGLDGYIARKFKLCSSTGEIYDHFSDSLYSGYLTTLLLGNIDVLQPYSYSVGYIGSMIALICNYDEDYLWIGKIVGAGGNEDGFSFLVPFLFVCLSWITHYYNILYE